MSDLIPFPPGQEPLSPPRQENGRFKAGVGGLYGRTPAKGVHEKQYEKPWHRTAAWLLASGKFTGAQVAIECDCTPQTISDLLKTEWFAKNVVEIQKQCAMEGDLMDIFRAEVPASMIKLIEVRDSAKSRPADIISASREILDRLRGKPQQTIRTESVQTSEDPVAEAERLERLNASLTKSASPQGETNTPASRISFDDTLPPA